MKCLSPILVNPHKGGFTVFTNNTAIEGVYVPCGQCIACRLNYGKFWSIRMMEELKNHDKACFVTLTYDPEHYIDTLSKRELQLFFKRLRKHRKVRFFGCGEHGDRFGRAHFHAIIYGIAPEEKELIEQCWQRGIVHVGTVTPDSCAYVAKYMTKKLRGKALSEKLKEDPDFKNEFVLMSRRPGIGSCVSDEMKKFMQETGFIYRKGVRSALPRYYKEKFGIVGKAFVRDRDDDIKHLHLYDTNDRIIRERLKFFGRK